MYIAFFFLRKRDCTFKFLAIQRYCNFFRSNRSKVSCFQNATCDLFFFIICKWYVCVIVLCLFYGMCTMVSLKSSRVTDVGNKIIFPIYNYHYSSETLCQHQSWPCLFILSVKKRQHISCSVLLSFDLTYFSHYNM